VRNIDFGGIAIDKLARMEGLQNTKQEAEMSEKEIRKRERVR